MGISDRKKKILAALVDEYIKTAEPVGSKAIAKLARKRLRKEDTMQYNVTVKTLPQRYAACVRMTIPCYEDEGMVWDVLCGETDHMHLIPDDPCYCSVTFLDAEYKEHDVEVEAQKTVKGQYPDTEHVKFRTLPAVTYARFPHIARISRAQTTLRKKSFVCTATIKSNRPCLPTLQSKLWAAATRSERKKICSNVFLPQKARTKSLLTVSSRQKRSIFFVFRTQIAADNR